MRKCECRRQEWLRLHTSLRLALRVPLCRQERRQRRRQCRWSRRRASLSTTANHSYSRPPFRQSHSPSRSSSIPPTISESVQPSLHPFQSSRLRDSSIPSILMQSSQWPNVLQPSMLHPNPASSPLLNLSPALDLSRNAATTTTWSIIREQIVQAGAGQTEAASNAGTLTSDLSGIQVAVEEPANMITTAQDFD